MREIGDESYLLKKLFYQKRNVSYTKHVPIGWRVYKREGLVTIDFNQTKRILILGGTGSGKTWLIRSLISRAYFSGINPIIMTDIAPEYYTSAFPLQEEFEKFLLENEVPQTLPIKVYYPYFLSKYFPIETKRIDINIFQFSLDSINPTDVLAFLDYESLKPSTRLEVENLVAQLSSNENKFENVEELIDYVQKREISSQLKSYLKRSIENLKNLGIFGNIYPPANIIDDINNNLVPDIFLFGWQRLELRKYVSIYISLIIRDILIARQMKKIKENKHLLLVFEESHEFVPTRGDSAQEIVKKEIERALLIGRKEKISFIFATQIPEKISNTILSQCDYVFVPRGFEVSRLKEIIKEMQPIRHFSYYDFNLSINRMMSSLRKYDDGMREWLCIERAGRIFSFAPLGPLNHHKTEGETL